MDWLGKGSLPQVYRKAYGFDADHTIETWKIAHWAFADRAWLTYRPCKPIPLTAPQPCLQVSGEEVKLWPRIDYRSELDAWSVPLYYADVTGWLRPGNQLKIMLWQGGEYPPGHLQILTSPLETSNDRKGK